MNIQTILSCLEKVNERYDGDYDLILNAPVVTWADEQLVECVSALCKLVVDLTARVNELEDPTGMNSR